MRISDGISDVCSSDLVRPMWLRTPADGARPPTGAPPSTPGYAASQRIRKRIEEAFGWIKSVAGMRKTKLRGLNKVDWAFRSEERRVGNEGVRTCRYRSSTHH